jgi:hypothetical protein
MLMNNWKEYRITKKVLLLSILLNLAFVSFSQNNDSTKVYGHFGAAVTVTNKGISLIPNLTLGKPAAIFDMSVGGKRLSFEPQFRFALEGKPWTFILWWRYKLVKKEKFQLNIGAHPAFAFKTVILTTDGTSQEITRAQHYLAGELVPSYSITNNISLSIYYLNAHGLEEDLTQSTNYLALRCNFSNIRLSEKFYMKFNPQVYYLKMDSEDGYYANATLTLARRNFPLSISTLVNRTIKTEIPVGEDFIWNVSLIYSFNNEYVRR